MRLPQLFTVVLWCEGMWCGTLVMLLWWCDSPLSLRDYETQVFPCLRDVELVLFFWGSKYKARLGMLAVRNIEDARGVLTCLADAGICQNWRV